MTKIVNNIETIESIIRQVFQNLDSKNYEQAGQLIKEANRISKEIRYSEGLSISLSIVAFLRYMEDKNNNYEKAIQLLDDAVFMAKRANSCTALLVSELIFGNINFSEENRDIALIHYNNALQLSTDEDKYSLNNTINTRIRQLQNNMDYSLPTKSDPLVSLVKISRSTAGAVP